MTRTLSLWLCASISTAHLPRLHLVWAFVLLAGCSDSPGGPDARAVSRVVALAAPTPYSGEALAASFRIQNAAGSGISDVRVTFETNDGTVAATPGVTDADGIIAVAWTLADRDGEQRLTARTGDKSATLTVTSAPRLIAIRLGDIAASLSLGSTVQLAVDGVSATGRTIPLVPGAFMVGLSETREIAELAVAKVDGLTLQATGPGSVIVSASVGALTSTAATIRVPRGTPIVTRLEPAEISPAGGMVTIVGYDLDALSASAVTLDGAPAPMMSRSSTAITITVPPSGSQCGARTTSAVAVGGAFTPNGALTLRRQQTGEILLRPGEWMRLPRAAQTCVIVPSGQANAEYALAVFDTRAMELSRTRPEQGLSENHEARFVASDRTQQPPTSARIVSMTANRGPALDVVTPSTGPGASLGVSSIARATPWAAGDTFSVSMDGRRYSGRIFRATSRLALGTLDRDASYNIVARLDGVQAAIRKFEIHGGPFLQRVFGDEWPATTDGSGQTLIVVGDFASSGLTFLGSGTRDRNVWIGIDPAIAEMPDRYYFSETVLMHEMAHAFQDRHSLIMCRDHADCSYDMWYNSWAVEGGAELLTEYFYQQAEGLSPDGNHSLARLSNGFGFVFYWGLDHPHYIFSRGYRGSSWLLDDIVTRAIRAGKPVTEAYGAVAKGAFEGWFGVGPNGPRPGLQQRMRDLLGTTWEPADAVVLALLSVAADDLTSSATLQVPVLRNAWENLTPAATFVLGDGLRIEAATRATVFAHYRIKDTRGAGGAVSVETGGQPMDWGIVRIR